MLFRSRAQSDFDQAVRRFRRDVSGMTSDFEVLAANILTQIGRIRTLRAGIGETAYKAVLSDVDQQLSRLLFPGYMSATPHEWLKQYPRYLKGVAIRLERVRGQLQRDEMYLAKLAPLEDKLFGKRIRLHAALLPDDARQRYRWMLEEFRISLYAQSLGTIMAVSEKRLAQQWLLVEEASDSHAAGMSA